MKTWKVVVTDDVQDDLDNFVYYLLVEKLSRQAAKAVLDDYDETIEELSKVAGALKPLEDLELTDYRKIRLRRHNYYLLYRLCGDTVIVDRMFHGLQDIDRVMKE